MTKPQQRRESRGSVARGHDVAGRFVVVSQRCVTESTAAVRCSSSVFLLTVCRWRALECGFVVLSQCRTGEVARRSVLLESPEMANAAVGGSGRKRF